MSDGSELSWVESIRYTSVSLSYVLATSLAHLITPKNLSTGVLMQSSVKLAG